MKNILFHRETWKFVLGNEFNFNYFSIFLIILFLQLWIVCSLETRVVEQRGNIPYNVLHIFSNKFTGKLVLPFVTL